MSDPTPLPPDPTTPLLATSAGDHTAADTELERFYARDQHDDTVDHHNATVPQTVTGEARRPVLTGDDTPIRDGILAALDAAYSSLDIALTAVQHVPGEHILLVSKLVRARALADYARIQVLTEL